MSGILEDFYERFDRLVVAVEGIRSAVEAAARLYSLDPDITLSGQSDAGVVTSARDADASDAAADAYIASPRAERDKKDRDAEAGCAPVTITDLRRVCLDIHKTGHTEVVTSFLHDAGVRKLDDLPRDLYQSLHDRVTDALKDMGM